jgi:PIN domain nuclease of toxin-antitoxin system
LRLLLDSHFLVWWPAGSPRLGVRARDLIMAHDTDLFVSAASWWELALKRAAGRLDVDLAAARRAFEKRGVLMLPITLDHAEAAAALPGLHSDPFDRMLVAQASAEDLVLLTRDKGLARYGSMVLAL